MGLLIGNVANTILPERVKEAVDIDIPMYGVKFPNNSTVGVRTYDAAGLNWSRSNNTTAGVDDFANLAPFNVRECCRIWDSGTSTASYVYKSSYSDTEWQQIREGTHATINGDIMIEVPEFWYRRVNVADGLEIIVAPAYKVGFTPDPWHYVKGVHHAKRYISKYIISAGFASISKVNPLVNTDMNTYRTGLRAKGMNMLHAPAWYSLIMLMLVKYANTDAQNTVSFGWSSGSVAHASGSADSVLGMDGSATAISANEGCLTMGIENFYGNVWKYVDGVFSNNSTLYFRDVEDVMHVPTSVAELLADYTASTFTVPNMDETVITTMANDPVYDWALFPSLTTGYKNVITTDIGFANGNFNCVLVGDNSIHGSGAGFFTFGASEAATSATGNILFGSVAVC